MQIKALQEELSREINDLSQPFPMTENTTNNEGGSPGLSVDAIAAASQRATKKLEKNIENIKKKVLPEALKTLESSLDQKMKTQIAMSTAKIEKKLKSIGS